jgi:hypothetical protein
MLLLYSQFVHIGSDICMGWVELRELLEIYFKRHQLQQQICITVMYQLINFVDFELF